MIISPLHDFVTIELDVPETVTPSGFIIVEKNPNKTIETGTVKEVGPGAYIDGRFDAMILKPGDRVMFNKGTGQVVKVDDVEVLFLKQRDIMGVLR